MTAKPCPICGKTPSEEAARYAPFCSSRCAQVDLNRWLKGSYAIPAVEEDDPDDSEESAPAQDNIH